MERMPPLCCNSSPSAHANVRCAAFFMFTRA
jgi:hypothetical protein